MSRAAAGAPIIVKPSNNVYTALAGIATLAALAAVIVLFTKAGALDWKPFAM
jgi:hypothetical protein